MTNGYFGQIGLADGDSEYNLLRFIIRQELAGVRTGVPVVVKAVHGGGVGAPPTVDVQPLVNQIDGQGNKTDHGTIYGIAVGRNQGGANAIINDPVAGDVGHLAVNDRDISVVKANGGKKGNPGSFRRHNLADGIYLAAVFAVTPTQYVQFTATGLRIVDINGNTILTSAAGINLNGLLIDLSGNLTTPGSVQAGTGGADSVTLQGHKHIGNNIAPTPGT
jgi:hypothetical protein